MVGMVRRHHGADALAVGCGIGHLGAIRVDARRISERELVRVVVRLLQIHVPARERQGKERGVRHIVDREDLLHGGCCSADVRCVDLDPILAQVNLEVVQLLGKDRAQRRRARIGLEALLLQIARLRGDVVVLLDEDARHRVGGAQTVFAHTEALPATFELDRHASLRVERDARSILVRSRHRFGGNEHVEPESVASRDRALAIEVEGDDSRAIGEVEWLPDPKGLNMESAVIVHRHTEVRRRRSTARANEKSWAEERRSWERSRPVRCRQPARTPWPPSDPPG